MLYEQKSFTLPTSTLETADRRWNFCFMTKEEFLAKYGQDAEEYRPYISDANIEENCR